MTSRTTPVGILVIALAGLIAVGCSAPTNAVFQALLDPAGTAVSATEADPIDDAAESSQSETWWRHPEGYAMVLPAGWTGVAVDRDQTDELVAAVTEAMPGLGERIEDTLVDSDARVSAIAADTSVEGDAVPVLIVLAQPTSGRKPHAIKSETRERISRLPGLKSPPSALDLDVPAANGVRFVYTIDDADLGELRVFSYLVRAGKTAYLVNFVASADVAADAEVVFYAIAQSLRFGA
jgi:molybdopterin biosynthesis enzyme MoaB